MNRKCLLVILGAAAAQCFGAAPAHAGAALDLPAGRSAWNANMNFDLLRDCPREFTRRTAREWTGSRNAARPEIWGAEGNSLWAKEQLGPHWSYQPLGSGPVIQFAALGAGRKERPGLAHVALDWTF